MSPTERHRVDPLLAPDDDVPTEQVPSVDPVRRGTGDGARFASALASALDAHTGRRGLANDEPSGPVAVPEIVPATDDGPTDDGPTGGKPTDDGPRDEPRDESGEAPVRARDDAAPPHDAQRSVPGTSASVDGDDPIDAWDASPNTVVAVELPAAPSALRRVGRRPRVRKVTRVVRHVDPWSAFKVALVFSAVAYVTALTSGVLLWNVASTTGTIDNVERWFTQFGWETFELNGGEIFHNAWIAGLFAAVGLTGLAVLVVTLFNLVSDMVGGVRVTVLEEEVVERAASSRQRYVVRRVGAPTSASASTSTWPADDAADTPSAAARASASATTKPATTKPTTTKPTTTKPTTTKSATTTRVVPAARNGRIPAGRSSAVSTGRSATSPTSRPPARRGSTAGRAVSPGTQPVAPADTVPAAQPVEETRG